MVFLFYTYFTLLMLSFFINHERLILKRFFVMKPIKNSYRTERVKRHSAITLLLRSNNIICSKTILTEPEKVLYFSYFKKNIVDSQSIQYGDVTEHPRMYLPAHLSFPDYTSLFAKSHGRCVP